MSESDYPEHDKLTATREGRRWVGAFLEWADHMDYHVTTTQQADEDSEAFEVPVRIEDALAAFFGIDQKKLAAEKEAMLAALPRRGARFGEIVDIETKGGVTT